MSDSQKIYSFLKLINDFKKVNRLSQVEKGGRRESDAEHSWHLTLAVWLCSNFLDQNIDLAKALKMSLIHDLVEIISSDVYGAAPDEQRAGKTEREQLAATKIFSQLPQKLNNEFMATWQEYEKRESEEAKLVWSLDKIMPRLQLVITETDAAKDLPTDTQKMLAQEAKISNFSAITKDLLNHIANEKNS